MGSSSINFKYDITYKKTDMELQSKRSNNQAYQEFVNCVNNTCMSPEIKKLGLVTYYFQEKTDVENPEWVKIILFLKLHGKKFEEKMRFSEQLRDAIDNSLVKLKNETDNLEQIIELEKQFYISIL